MLTSLIYLTKNGGDTFAKSLRMVFEQERDFSLEVIVVDSGSNDQTLQICSANPVRLIEIPPSSFDHSSTRNLALAQAKGERCVFIVQDAIPVNRKWLATLVEPFRDNDKLAGVFGQQVSREDASPLSRSCKLLWYQEWRENWRQPHEQLPILPDIWRNLSADERKRLARFDNVNSCIRKSVWQQIPFPEVPYAEDLAWASAVLTSGYSLFWQPDAMVLHSHTRSLAYEFRRSYVDMKNIASIVDERSPGVTRQQAAVVIEWLTGEARRFSDGASPGRYGATEHDIAMIAEADARWQSLNGREGVPEKPAEGSLAWFSPLDKRINAAMLHHLYRALAGPQWFRNFCRGVAGRIWRNDRQPGNAPTVTTPSVLLELQGRHRFFLNQLLQIHFAQKGGTAESVGSIRLGAAAMVGGSVLGHYMSGVDSSPGVPGREGEASAGSGSEGHAEFWQSLAAWCVHSGSQGSDALLALDRLLSRGV